MPYTVHDLHPVEHITIDAVGAPGQRTFYLQASQGSKLVTLIIEKEQARALAHGIQDALANVAGGHAEGAEDAETARPDLSLREPIISDFRVGALGLAYDEDDDMFVIVAQELTEEDDEESAMQVRFWATKNQMHLLSQHALEVVAAGRPICPLCGEPIDPTGHFCPRGNGHKRVKLEL